MDFGLDGKNALVLGASRGLGAAIARGLAMEGAEVIAAARSTDATAAWIAALPADVAARVSPCVLDTGNRDDIERVVAEIGAVDILVNNGGGPPPGGATAFGPDMWMRQFEAMAANQFHLTQLLLPAMKAKGWGRIVTVASTGVVQPIPNLALSNGVRAAVVGWSKTLSAEVAADGITVNVALPGRIATARLEQIDAAAAKQQDRSVEAVATASQATIPAGRYGRADEFADVVVFLCSTRASYVTGATIRVDGGMVRSV